MDANETGTTASVYRHTGSVDVVEVRQTIRHDGNAITGGCIPRLVVSIPKADLLVI